jgi:uncharacterized protein
MALRGRPERAYDGFVPGRFPIDAYGKGGFRFADMSHRGSLLALPSGIRALAARVPGDLDRAALGPVFEEKDEIEYLLIGTGPELALVDAGLERALRAAGMRVEIMPTHAAAQTYNVLLAEDRRVAAVLLAIE